MVAVVLRVRTGDFHLNIFNIYKKGRKTAKLLVKPTDRQLRGDITTIKQQKATLNKLSTKI